MKSILYFICNEHIRSPYDDSVCMLTPEHSIEIQTAIGADIMMQLDDVVDATHTGQIYKVP